MASLTPNFSLRKPASTDTVDVGTDLNDNWDIIDGALGAGGVSGWVDISETTAADGVTDDAAAINAAIGGSPVGSVIYFPPGRTWGIGAPIVLLPNRSYLGASAFAQSTGASRIRALAGFTGTGMLVSNAWYTNATTSDGPIRVQGLEINGNSVAGTKGLILTNFWSRVYDCHFRATASHGVELNDRTANGTNIITNSASEPTIVECRFEDIGGDAVHQEANGTPPDANLDGRVIGCFFSTITGHGINLGRAAGWAIETNHMYGIGLDAVRAQNCYATIVRGNYIENFGQADLAGGFYTGIGLATVLDGRASIVADNTVSTEAPSSPTGSRWTCFYARANSTQLRAMAVFSGNTAMFASGTAPATKRSHAYRFGEAADAGRLLQVEWSGNQIEQTTSWENTRVVGACVTLNEPGRSGVHTLTDGATVALDAARARVFKLVAADNRTISVPTNAVDGQGLIIAHTASAAARTLTLTTGSAGAFAFGADVTGLTATASGTTDYIGCIYDATAARFRVVSYAKGY